MNEEAFGAILKELETVAKEAGLKETGKESGFALKGDEKEVKVAYLEDRKMFELHIYDITDGSPSEEPRVASSWLFDEAHNIRDARAIGVDFSETLREEFGIKPKPVKRDVSLPAKGAPGATPGPEALAQRFLTLFPTYKEVYKEHVAKHGDFLYDSFFAEYATPELRRTLIENNRKNVEKFVSMLNDIYCTGDLDVQGVVLLTIVAEAVGDNEKLTEIFLSHLDERPHFKSGIKAMLAYAAKKKLIKK